MFLKKVFKNGLRVILAPMKNTKSVTCLVLVGVGSKYEKKSKNGISHFLEHICFKGTRKRPDPLAISKELDRVGGTFNAFTGKDYTGYYVKVTNRHLNLALDVVSDIFLNSLFKEAEIEKEKGVILEEIKLIEDTPTRYIDDLFERLLYGDQPAGWSIAGKREAVLKIKREDLLFWTKSFYKAENTVVTLAGSFDPKKALTLIQNYFLAIPSGAPSKKTKVKETQFRPAHLLYKKQTKQAHLALGVRTFNIFHPARYPIFLLSVILGGNMSSRLFQRLREKEGLAYYVSSEVEVNPESGYLVTFTGVDQKQIPKALSILLEEYSKIKKEGVKEGELRLAKDCVKGKLFLSLEESQNVSSFYGVQELLENRLLTPKEQIREIEKVNLREIQKNAKEIFQPQRLNLALIAPKRSKISRLFFVK